MRTTAGEVLVALAIAFAVSGVANALVTPDQAKAVVRAFEDDPALQFGEVALREDKERPVWQHRSWYDVRISGYPEPDRLWNVDAESGDVTFAFYGDAGSDEESDEPWGPLTQEQCRQIAENFARAHYAGFDSMGLESQTSEWAFTGWDSLWRQKVAHGAWGASCVSVTVNPANGAVYSYSSWRIPVPDPPAPQLTAEEAVNRAEQVTGVVTTEWVEGPTLVADPEGTYWDLALEGLNGDGFWNSYAVTLNAVTGEAIQVAAAAKSQYPKTKIATPHPDPAPAGPTPIRELLSGVPNAFVHWLGSGKARLTIQGRSFTLAAGSSTVVGDGRTFKLSSPVQLVSGRLLVPPDLLERLR